VKVVTLPVLAGGAVVDWLDAGHDVHELHQLIAATPYWTPTSRDDERRERRRRQTRERVAKSRARARAALSVTCEAANVRTAIQFTCNAPYVSEPVTRNAVTHTERSSKYFTQSSLRTRERHALRTALHPDREIARRVLCGDSSGVIEERRAA
jgi:hypothetical protein